MSQLEQVAKALRDELVHDSYSKDFNSEIILDPTMKLEDADTLHVDVVPVKFPSSREVNGYIQWDCTTDVGIRYRYGLDDQDDVTGKIDDRHVFELMDLEEEIINSMMKTGRLQYLEDAVLSMDPTLRVTYVPKHLREWRQFTGIIRVTYRTDTEITDE